MQYRLLHRHAGKRFAEVVSLALINDLRGGKHLLRQPAQHFLGKVHEIAVIRIRLIEFKHGEFRIVARGQSFVAEIAVDLEDLFETAHHQALEIQFRGDTQKQLHVEGVMMRDKRPRRRTPGNRLHHRRFHFQKIPFQQETPDIAHRRRAHAKGLARRLVHDQIQIALPVLGFLIRQTVEFLRQGTQRLGQ